jgi:hypothetical protein
MKIRRKMIGNNDERAVFNSEEKKKLSGVFPCFDPKSLSI